MRSTPPLHLGPQKDEKDEGQQDLIQRHRPHCGGATVVGGAGPTTGSTDFGGFAFANPLEIAYAAVEIAEAIAAYLGGSH